MSEGMPKTWLDPDERPDSDDVTALIVLETRSTEDRWVTLGSASRNGILPYEEDEIGFNVVGWLPLDVLPPTYATAKGLKESCFTCEHHVIESTCFECEARMCRKIVKLYPKHGEEGCEFKWSKKHVDRIGKADAE